MLYKIGRFIFVVYFHIFYKVSVQGIENMPKSGGVIICSNHIHWLDPLLIAVCLKRTVNFMAKAELYSNKFFAFILRKVKTFPVKRGTADISAIKNALKIIKSQGVLGIFPEGTRSKDGNLKPAEPGVAMIAVKTNAPVIPIRIKGDYRIFGRVKLIVGNPMPFNEFANTKLTGQEINDLSQLIMKEIGKLA